MIVAMRERFGKKTDHGFPFGAGLQFDKKML
jgi:hypothetical protein